MVSKMPEQRAVTAFLQQLDAIFGTPSDPTPATSSLALSQVSHKSRNRKLQGQAPGLQDDYIA